MSNVRGGFRKVYKAITILDCANVEAYGNRIVLPATALMEIYHRHHLYPFLFKLTSRKGEKKETHCGVMQFDAEEGQVYLPEWLMEQLGLVDFDPIQVEKVRLPTGSFARFKPFTESFFNIPDPRSALETCLRRFACLTSGDVIRVVHGDTLYRLAVVELQPAEACCIIECDLEVDFLPAHDPHPSPPDYFESQWSKVRQQISGQTLNGKESSDPRISESKPPVIADYQHRIGMIHFKRHFK